MLLSDTIYKRNNELDLISRLLLAFFFILFLSILAGYNILFETTDSVAYKEFYDSIDNENPFGISTFEI